MADYAPPVDALLNLGPGEPDFPNQDYHALGLGPEHIPDLIRLARDRDFFTEDFENPKSWGPVHALWALGDVGGEAAIEPLIDLMSFLEDQEDDWLEDIPAIMGKIGPAAVAPLARLLADDSKSEWVRVGASSSLRKIAESHPEARAVCVETLTHQLSLNDPRVPTLNGVIVSELLDLEATESALTIEQAYEADCIDTTITGSWNYARYSLGLGPEPPAPRPFMTPSIFHDPEYRKSRPDPKKLLKRKAQKEARKKQQARSKRRKRK